MSRTNFTNNQDSNSDAEIARRRSFIERMERKLEHKTNVLSLSDQDDRYLI